MVIRTPWKQWQRDFLIENYSSMGADKIASIIGKTKYAVANEAKRRNLKKAKKPKIKKVKASDKRIVAHRYKGTTSEKELCMDVAAALNEYGFLWDEELMEYLIACDNIGKLKEGGGGHKPKPLNINKIYDFIISEQKRVEAGE